MSITASEAFVPKRLVSDAFHELKLLSPYMVVVVAYILGVMALAHFTGNDSYFQATLYREIMHLSAVLALPVGCTVYVLYLMIAVRERQPLARFKRDLIRHILSPRGLIGWAIPMATMGYFISTLSSMKTLIAVLNPFFLDPFLSKADSFLHFGIAPWKITHFLFGGLAPTMALNIAYNAWFFIIWIYLFCQMFSLAGSNHRARYLLSFVLCWVIVGSVLAFFLSSAGPCYYGRVTGLPDPYAPLMNGLAAMDAPQVAAGSYWHIWSLATQNLLWSEHFLTKPALGSGISAMPSMHVSMAYLIAFSAMRINRWFGRVMLAYAIVISIGSVHLGWHYALDGYVSIAVTWLIWRFAGFVIDRLDQGRDQSEEADREDAYAVQSAY